MSDGEEAPMENELIEGPYGRRGGGGYRRGSYSPRRRGGGGLFGALFGPGPGRLFRRAFAPAWSGLSLAAWTLRNGLWYPWWYWLSPEYYQYQRPVAVTYADGTVRHLVPPYPPGTWGRYAPPPGGFREQPVMYAGQPVCDHCEVKPIAVQCGHGCETAYYCGQECADAHYEKHEGVCEK